MNTEQQSPGLVKRALAFTIDAIAAMLVGSILVWPFSQNFVQYPLIPSILIWLFVSIYYGVFESKLVQSETLGKKLFGLRVVGSDGGEISFQKAFFRRFFMLIPFFNGVIGSTSPFTNPLYMQYTHSVFFAALSVLIVGLVVHCFMHPQKRALHDLVFQTRVVKNDTSEDVGFVGLSNKSTYSSSLVVVLCLAGIIYFNFNSKEIMSSAGLDEITKVQEKIVDATGLKSVGVQRRTFSITGGETTEWLNISLSLTPEKYLDQEYKKNFVQTSIQAVNESINTSIYKDIKFTFTKVRYYGLFQYSHSSTDAYDFEGNPLESSSTN